MSDYKVPPEASIRVNATNYDEADIMAVINGDAVEDEIQPDINGDADEQL